VHTADWLDSNTAEIDSDTHRQSHYTTACTSLILMGLSSYSQKSTSIIFERPAAVKLMRPELGRDSYFPPVELIKIPFKIWAQIYCMCMEFFFESQG